MKSRPHLDRRIEIKCKERPIDDELSGEVFADRELSFEERIDAKIDRDIKQLMQIKTMKAICPRKPRTPAKTDAIEQAENQYLRIESRP